jgi:hypothetical protein
MATLDATRMTGGAVVFHRFNFPHPATIIDRPCHQHIACIEYSVIPADPTRQHYILHLTKPDMDEGECTIRNREGASR